jgi:hypothetical protein
MIHGLLVIEDKEIRIQLLESLEKIINLDESNLSHITLSKIIGQLIVSQADNLNTIYRASCNQFF